MNRYAITIPKPCHEDWAAMTPEEKGRFCALCQKTVVDFTTMNTKQVDAFFDANAGTKVCGRFTSDQLSEPIRIEVPRKALFMQRSFLNIFLLALTISMGTTLFSCKRATGEPALVGEIAVVDSTSATNQSGFKPAAKDSAEVPAPPHATTGMPVASPTPAPLLGDVVVSDTIAEPVKGKVKVSE